MTSSTSRVRRALAFCLGGAVISSLALGGDTAPTPSCDVIDGIVSICGLQKPEDLTVAPNRRDIIFGQIAENGSLAALDTANSSIHKLYPGSDSRIAKKELWGAPSCVNPSEIFQPHGIDLSQRVDGRWQLLAVNHGGRESVEFFEVLFTEQDRPRLVWRGCAVAPEQGSFNDVAALADDGFLVTHMADIDHQMWQLFLSLFGADTGFVYRWDQAKGYYRVAGTEGKMPNGIIVSPDKTTFFVNYYFDNEMRKYDLATGEMLGAVSVDKPDNLSWNPRGGLYVASLHASLFALFKSVNTKSSNPSLLPFSIYEVDPQTLQKKLVVERNGRPMGAGTVAVEVDGYLYIGSYAGDRIIKMVIE
ncbi:MAG: hypothetical protein ACI8QT_001384 [Halioglobus sp.]|jgi:hypothetical protein